MSTTVLNQRTATKGGPSGSTIVSVFAAFALAAVIGYGIAQDNGASSSAEASGTQFVAARTQAGLEQAEAIRIAQLTADFPRTDAIWSGKADLVNGQVVARVFPRTDAIWSGEADLANGLSPVTNTSTSPVSYGPMGLSAADLIAFEMGYSAFPRTDSIWSGTADLVNGSVLSNPSGPTQSVVSGGWDVINGGPVEQASEPTAQALGGGGPRSPHYFE